MATGCDGETVPSFSDSERRVGALMAEFNGDWRAFPIERLSPAAVTMIQHRMRELRLPRQPRKPS